jgi:hypothetical protein
MTDNYFGPPYAMFADELDDAHQSDHRGVRPGAIAMICPSRKWGDRAWWNRPYGACRVRHRHRRFFEQAEAVTSVFEPPTAAYGHLL